MERGDSGRLEGLTARLAVSVLQSPSPAGSHLVSGETPWARAPDQRHSQGGCTVAGVAAGAGAALGDLSPRGAPRCPGTLGAQTPRASLQLTGVGGSGGALRSCPPAHTGGHAAPGVTPPSTVRKSVCAAGSLPCCAATCCRPRRARGHSWRRPRIRSWHSAGEGSRMRPTGATALSRPSPQPSRPTMLAAWRCHPVQSSQTAVGCPCFTRGETGRER